MRNIRVTQYIGSNHLPHQSARRNPQRSAAVNRPAQHKRDPGG